MTEYLDINIDHPAWRRVPRLRSLCRQAAAAALGEIGAGPAGIAVLLTGDRRMAALNAAWRGVERATNVLSLADGPTPDRRRVGGDIVLAFETVEREAATGGLAFEDHVRHLLVHGILHLAGHDHRQAAAAERMERLEAQVLARLGVADPHAEPGADRPAACGLRG